MNLTSMECRIRISKTTTLRGQVQLPASKSITNRVLLVGALCPQREAATALAHAAHDHLCDDTRAMLQALRAMPATVDVGAAGTAMRFLTALLSVQPGTHLITGSERMKQRPIGALVEALRQLGACVAYIHKEGFPPLRITGGTCQGGHIALPGDVSSQFVSALLMIGPVLSGGLEIELTGHVASRPYIDMTLGVMRHFGAQVWWTGERRLRVEPTGYRFAPYSIERDWSAASYWYQMVALCSDPEAKVELPALCRQSLQGDAVVSRLFESLGVATTYYVDAQGVEGVQLCKTRCSAACMEYNFEHQPDLAQTLVATCCGLGIPFRFGGLESLRIKETDRIQALCAELDKLGFALQIPDEGTLCWDGRRGSATAHAVLATHHDHRMAMCLAPLCLCLGPLQIEDSQVVRKSYPLYWQHLQQMGFAIHPNFMAPC